MRRSVLLVAAALVLWQPEPARAHGAGQQGGAAATGFREADTTVSVIIDPEAATAQVVQVPRGAHVHLIVHGAGSGNLHLHGYDVSAMGEEGQPVLIIFDAAHAGRFPVEMHIDEDLLGRRERAVLYVEVREE